MCFAHTAVIVHLKSVVCYGWLSSQALLSVIVFKRAAFEGVGSCERRRKFAQPMGAVPGGGADTCVDPAAADWAVAELAHPGPHLASAEPALR